MQKFLLKIRYFERGLSKSLTKVNFIFLNPVFLMDKVIKNKRGLELVKLQAKFRKLPFSVKYYLTKCDDVTKSGFWIVPKITSAKLCKSARDIINYSASICTFESGKFGKEGKNYEKLNISRTKRAF